MSFNKKTISEYDITNKTVLVRVDYNVPLSDSGEIRDDYRIKQSIPTLNYLIEKNCKLILCAHLGRPSGPGDTKYSLAPVAKHLSQLLGREVVFVNDCVGEAAQNAAKSLQNGQVILLENLRFHPEEADNDEAFSKQLASLAEVFVQDGFGVSHETRASTVGVTHFLPSLAGLLLEKEVDTITSVMENPKKPLTAIVGGAKIADKIDILKRFIDIADALIVAGAMANTFLLAKGIKIGKSLADKDDLQLAKDIMETAAAKATQSQFVFYLPQDCVVAKTKDSNAQTRIVDWSAHIIAEIEAYPKIPTAESAQVADDEEILDIGPFSGAFVSGLSQLSSTVVWNGTLGVTETPALQGPVGPFAHGTELLVGALTGQFGHKPYTLVGGGDTAGYISTLGLVDKFSHVSTGGGASLDLMSGHSLPGVEALLNKDAAGVVQ
ncbi:MAG TPA: phosphoglycerate kinase [Candidatus Saccharimonadales bacterium]|nr:phosphoglycerate kinase [Candidatus Saccharimonadales bacterium]